MSLDLHRSQEAHARSVDASAQPPASSPRRAAWCAGPPPLRRSPTTSSISACSTRRAGGPVQLVRLFDGDLPESAKKRKKKKADLESLLHLPPLPRCPGGALLTLGSGSRPNRRRGALLGLDAAGALLGQVQGDRPRAALRVARQALRRGQHRGRADRRRRPDAAAARQQGRAERDRPLRLARARALAPRRGRRRAAAAGRARVRPRPGRRHRLRLHRLPPPCPKAAGCSARSPKTPTTPSTTAPAAAWRSASSAPRTSCRRWRTLSRGARSKASRRGCSRARSSSAWSPTPTTPTQPAEYGTATL